MDAENMVTPKAAAKLKLLFSKPEVYFLIIFVSFKNLNHITDSLKCLALPKVVTKLELLFNKWAPGTVFTTPHFLLNILMHPIS
jgi:hypothetical protein